MSNLSLCLDFVRAAGLPIARFPETNQEADVAEELLAQAMAKMSMDEHEKIILDMHGVVSVEKDEDPTTIERKLKELQLEVEATVQKDDAYLLAKEMNESYVTNRNFCLMFLRHEKFHVKSTAKLILQHFQVKQKLFGNGEILARDVRQSDLGSKNLALLESGCFQILPNRDVAGRALFFMTPCQVIDYPEEYCAIWYLSMKALQDEETQRMGVIWIVLNFNGYKVAMDHFCGVSEVLRAVPHRIVGGHFCYTDSSLRPYATGFQLFASVYARNRLRMHFGTLPEIDFELKTYGIPTEDFPLGDDGKCSPAQHRKWLAMLRAQEEAAAAATTTTTADDGHEDYSIVVPHRFDVLFGKSRQAQKHTGTQRALHIVEMYYEAYEKLGKFQKTDMAEKIISIIHESGGRFLRQDEQGLWIVADDTEARKKVAHWFRKRRLKRLAAAASTIEPTAEVPTDEDLGNGKQDSGSNSAKRVTPRDSPIEDEWFQERSNPSYKKNMFEET